MSADPGPQRTIGQLVADASHDIQGIVHSEVALAKAEISSGAKHYGKGAGLFGAAAFVGLLALIFLFHTAAKVIDIWLPEWAAYGIVTLLMLLVAAVLGLLGWKSIKGINPMPTKAIAEAKQTMAALKS